MKQKSKELICEFVRQRAAEWYGEKEDVAIAMLVSDYGKEATRGYAIFGWSDDIGEFDHIERINDIDIYGSDIEAAKQAKKDGIKLIPYSEQPKKGAFRHYRFLDTPLNRHRLSKI